MKNKRIFKDFQASKMSLNIYTSPLLAFVFVFIGEFVAFTLYGIGLLLSSDLLEILERLVKILQATCRPCIRA
ncbi:caax amino protease family [Streptococcus pneumoniae]|nr:caax amino protease family [Streptococcus pneumoniae]